MSNRLPKKWVNLTRSMGFKVAFIVGLILLSSYVVFIYLIVDVQQEFHFSQLLREASRFSSAIMNAIYNSMLHDNPKATMEFITDLSNQHEISRIRIYNHQGVVRFATDQAEVGTQVNKRAEACYACHVEDQPFNEIHTDKRTRVSQDADGRSLGMITPIYNETGCWNSKCHFHPSDQKVLGVLDVKLSLKDFDLHIRTLVEKIIFFGITAFCAVLGTIVTYLAIRLHMPVERLKHAFQQVAAGDLNYQAPVESNDQLGELSEAFNKMGQEIRKRTQELVRSQWEYKNLFEQVPCFICVINEDFQIVRQNTYMSDLFKGSVGMKCHEVFKKRTQRCEDCHAIKTLTDGSTSQKQHCGLTVSGEEANYVSYTTPIFDQTGKVIYAMVIAMDVGDKVKLQKELQVSKDFQTNLIENSIHGIIATDDTWKIAIYNNAAQDLLQYKLEDVIGDADLQKYFPHPFVETILASQANLTAHQTRLVTREATLKSADGELISVSFSGFMLFDNSKPSGAVGFFQDLRTFKRLEREKQASDRLAVVGQTVAGLAHGIKNIIQGLEGGLFVVESAMEDNDKKLLQRGWLMVQNNIVRISNLVKDLLNYSKERNPEYESIDPNQLAEEVCNLFDIKAKGKGISILRDYDPNLGKGIQIFLDHRGIHTCLSNLVSNAIDACEADSGKTEHKIMVRTSEDPDGGMVFEVSDDGMGMTDETKRKLFSSFYSTKGSRGTGLGLLVTSKIVSEHAGQMFFDSELGVGSHFIIKLPARSSNQIHADKKVFGSEDLNPAG